MEILKNPHIDFLGKKLWFIGASVVVIALGLLSIFTRGIPQGIDFRGGADVRLRFQQMPPLDQLRSSLGAAGFHGLTIQSIGDPKDNEVLIRLDPSGGSDNASAREEQDIAKEILGALRTPEEKAIAQSRLDLNVAGENDIRTSLIAELGPGHEGEAATAAAAIAKARNDRGGLLPDVASVKSLPEVTPGVAQWLDGSASAGRFAVRSVDYVGPAVGHDLRQKAQIAVVLSLIAMLVYIAFRFNAAAYGVSAIITLAHDVLITLGFLSFFQKEFDLTVLAAVLTIVGYSINDTIVIFDRVRDNLRMTRTTNIEKVFNDSINQTLSRTMLTNLLVFMVLLSIWLFGGERLEPFSFALIVGSVSGTYSTIYIAAPIVIWWMRKVNKKTARA